MPPPDSTPNIRGTGARSVVVRHDLLRRLTDAGRVTYIAAPPGTGKTVLVRSWIAERGLAARVAWVTVAHPESDAQQFWLGVLDQLAGVLTDAASVTPAPDLDLSTIVSRVLALGHALTAPAWLVLDDLHELVGAANEPLEQLLAEAPSQLRFVLIARRDLRLGLHRLRLEGELTEIRQADLRFGLDDARTLFRAAALDPPEAILQDLLERTEGWAAGLRLAALSLVGSADPDQLARHFSGTERTVAEYLLAEVLERQPTEVAQLLLRTSILERVNGPLADQLTGSSSGQRILGELEQSGAFVVALDSQRSWFRYHRLFAEMLMLELRRTAPGELTGLHERAAAWLDEHGFAVEAIRQAQAAGSWPLAARILADEWYNLYFDGQAATARELIGAFPPGMSETDPELATVAGADAVARGAMEEVEQYIAIATDRLSAVVGEDRRRRLQVALTGMALVLSRTRNDLPAVVEAAERLLAPGEAAGLADPRLTGTVRTLALCNLGSAELWTGRFAAAEDHLDRALASARESRRPMLELIALTHLALLQGLRHRWHITDPTLEAIELAERNGWAEEAPVAMAHCVLGLSHLWRGRLADADARLVMTRRCLRGDAEPAGGVLLLTAEGLLELARDRPAAALERFDQAATLGDGLVSTHIGAAPMEAFRVLALLRSGERDPPRDLRPGTATTADAAWARVAEAGRQLRDGSHPRAGSIAASVSSDSGADPLGAVLAGLIEAQAAQLDGDAGTTARALERSLDQAEPSGLLLPFLIFPVGALLERHQRLGSAHASLIAEILSLLAGRTPAAGSRELPPLREPLSDSELRVLRYLATNLQAPEIAGELFVSVNTVRTHMRHLYGKLDVHRRADAVAQARQRGLLAPSAPRG